jgi:type I restriction enzyme S subunit
MKAGWKTVKLGEVCSFERGLTYSKSDEADAPGITVLRANNVDLNSGQLNFEDLRYIHSNVAVDERKYLSANSIIVCTASGSRDHLGKTAHISEPPRMTFGGFMGLLRPHGKIDSRFLFYLTRSDLYRGLISSLSAGTNINNLKGSDLLSWEIPLPPLAEQKRIVAILDEAFKRIDEAKAKVEANIEDASLLLKSYFSSTFSQGGAEWAEKTLGDTCEMYQPKTIGMKDLVPDGPYPVFGANGVIGKYDKYNHEEPQLLITCRGATCGAVNISEHHSWITGNAMVVRPKDAEIDLQFLEFFFRGGVDISVAITGTAQPQITRTNLEPLIVRFPRSVAEQKNHVKTFKSLTDETRALANTYAQKLKMINELQSSLLAQAFAGELTA